MGTNIIKKVVLVIYILNNITANMLAIFNHSSGIKINNEIINVMMEIGKLNELEITML